MADADRTPDEIRTWLTQIIDTTALLPDAAITRTPAAKTRRPIPSSKPPTPLEIIHLLDRRDKHQGAAETWVRGMQYVDPDRIGVLPYLDGWMRDIEATLLDEHPEVPDDLPTTPTVATCCDWLARHADAAATTTQWPELVYGLRILRRNLRDATQSVRDIERRPVPCSRCGDPLTQVGQQAMWECNNGHVTTVEAVTLRQAHERLVADRADGQWVPSMGTLKDWSRRPGVLPCLRESDRVSLYDLATIRKLVVERRLRGA